MENNNFVNANSSEEINPSESNNNNSNVQNMNANSQRANANVQNANTQNRNANAQNANFNNTQSNKSNYSKPNNGFNAPKVKKEKQKNNFGKTVVVPFFSGVIGAALVITTCVNVPTIKSKLIGNNSQTSVPTTTVTSSGNVNTNYISLSDINDTGVAVAAKVLPSVVGINVTYSVNSIFSNNTSTATAEGSGVIISSDGYILTNNHVVNSSSSSSSSFYELGSATKITVTLYNDETEYDAKIVGTDSKTDLAVIKIDKTDLTAATLGDSSTVQVGEWCMAIGNPLGMQSTVTTGTISALNREITDSDGKTYTVIQTDAAINSGNSGGALVNSNGEVIGINSIKASGTGVEGLGFAIPINSTKSIYSDLIKYNKVIRPYIGVRGIDITDEIIKNNPTYNLVKGFYVRSVDDFSPAQKAGIQAGDIIVKADGTTVENVNELNEIKNKHSVGDTMELTINRDGTEKTVTVTLVEEPSDTNTND